MDALLHYLSIRRLVLGANLWAHETVYGIVGNHRHGFLPGVQFLVTSAEDYELRARFADAETGGTRGIRISAEEWHKLQPWPPSAAESEEPSPDDLPPHVPESILAR